MPNRFPTKFGRRGLCQGASALTLLGCGRRATNVETVDPELKQPAVPATIASVLHLDPSDLEGVQQALEHPIFEHPTGGVHYLRLLPFGHGQLLLSAVFDSDLDSLLSLLAENASRVDAVLSKTRGYPAKGAADLAAMGTFLRANAIETMMLYSAFNDASEPAIREATELRSQFLNFVKSVSRDHQGAERAYDSFLSANQIRVDAHEEGTADQLPKAALSAPQRQNPFTMVFELREDWIERLDKTLIDGQWFLDHLHIHPLKKIPTVHYARFARITPTRILFESVYDGEWDQYLTDFAINIPTQLDAVWGGAVGYPKKGAADAAALTEFLDSHRIDRDYFYMAYPNNTVKEVQKSLELGKALVRFSKEAPRGSDALLRHLDRFVHRHQALLA